jgi:competence protein ComEA
VSIPFFSEFLTRYRFMPRSKHLLRASVVATMLTTLVRGDVLPPGPGRAATIRVCGKCHSPERAASLHQSGTAWEETIAKMVKLGAQGSDEEFEAILSYLSKNFGREIPAPLNINKATAVDLETALLLRRSQAKAVIQYRSQNGDFKSIDDLRKVPGLDFRKIEQKKSRIVF